MIEIFRWVMLVIATERVTEIIVASKLFDPLRKIVKRWAYPLDNPPEESMLQEFKIMIDYLMSCGYCVSVWVGFLFAICLDRYFDNVVINWAIGGLVLHGLANFYHVLYEICRRGRVYTYDISAHVDNKVNMNGDSDV